MNITIYILAGAFVGAFIATTVICIPLLRERNKIDRQIAEHLRVLSEWCQQNWTR